MLSISIIIPYYNRRDTIDRCLKSIDVFLNANIEVIIVDDYSDDPLGDLGNPSITTIRLDSNMGPVAARSYGASIAKSEYLMFLDSDDELLLGWYDIVSSVICAKAKYDVYGFPDEKFRHGVNFCISDPDEYWKWVPLAERASDYMLVIRSSIYSRVVMPKLRISEIWYIVQLFESGGEAHYSEKSLFRYNQDAGNQLSRSKSWDFDVSDYRRNSLCYSINIFKRNEYRIKKYACEFYYAWLKRFLKECCLCLSFKCIIILAFSGRNVKE